MKARQQQEYTISVYVRGMPGFFRYTVKTRDQAMDHFGAIVAGGYRRPNDRGIFEWFAPALIERVRIAGPGLESKYADEFVRT